MIAPNQGLSRSSEKHSSPVSLKQSLSQCQMSNKTNSIKTISRIILDKLNPSLLFKILPLLVSLFHQAREVWVRVCSSESLLVKVCLSENMDPCTPHEIFLPLATIERSGIRSGGINNQNQNDPKHHWPKYHIQHQIQNAHHNKK